MSNAVYLWDFLVALGVQADDFSTAEQTAYRLYHQHKFDPVSDGNALKQWCDYVVKEVSKPQYADHFSQSLIQEAKRLQHQLNQKPQSVLELDMLMQLGGGDSLDRVIYQGIKNYNIGVYDPRYPLWSNFMDQLPNKGVERVLATLPPLSGDIQHISLDQLEVPRNNRAAAELMQQWLEQNSFTKEFSINTEKKWSDSEDYFINLNKQGPGCIQSFSVWFRDLTYIKPGIGFIIDCSQQYLSAEQQQNAELVRKFDYRFNDTGFFTNFGTPNQKLAFSELIKRWDSPLKIAEYFEKLDEWIKYVMEHLSTPEKINQYYNHRQDKTIVHSNYAYYPNLNIAAIVKDPALPELYQQEYDAIPVEKEFNRNQLKAYYENDLAEVCQIVDMKSV